MKKIPRLAILIVTAISVAVVWAILGRGNADAAELEAHGALLEVMSSGAPNAFTTDGCSGGMSRSFQALTGNSPSWENCCVAHDEEYHIAANAKTAEESFAARLTADEALRECVKDSGARAAPIIAEVMFRAVRFGGAPCTGKPYRWGYGFPNCEVD